MPLVVSFSIISIISVPVNASDGTVVVFNAAIHVNPGAE